LISYDYAIALSINRELHPKFWEQVLKKKFLVADPSPPLSEMIENHHSAPDPDKLFQWLEDHKAAALDLELVAEIEREFIKFRYDSATTKFVELVSIRLFLMHKGAIHYGGVGGDESDTEISKSQIRPKISIEAAIGRFIRNAKTEFAIDANGMCHDVVVRPVFEIAGIYCIGLLHLGKSPDPLFFLDNESNTENVYRSIVGDILPMDPSIIETAYWGKILGKLLPFNRLTETHVRDWDRGGVYALTTQAAE